jgi:hypothetical protein
MFKEQKKLLDQIKYLSNKQDKKNQEIQNLLLINA